MENWNKLRHNHTYQTKRLRGPLEVRLFALRRGYGSKIGKHVTEPMLARLLGCTVSHYQRMEKGIHPFKDEYLRKLAYYYGADFDELKRLRDTEQLLLRAGFPQQRPAPASALRIGLRGQPFACLKNKSSHLLQPKQAPDIRLLSRTSGACSVFPGTTVRGSLIPAAQITMCFSPGGGLAADFPSAPAASSTS